VVAAAAKDAPHLLARASSASAMWTANAATVTPATDSGDGRVHMTVANLRAMQHRSIEPPQTARTLRAVFRDPSRFAVHDALPGTAPDGGPSPFGDEGAANHTRFRADGNAGGGVPGVHLFAFGARADGTGPRPSRHPARQTLEASRAVAERHGIPPERCVFAQQHPDAIDAGVFHNDVIAVGSGRTLLVHEHAFAERERTLAALRETVPGLVVVEVRAAELPVETAVRTYLFNSQLLELDGGRQALVLPIESREDAAVASVIDRIMSDPANPIAEAHSLDVRESMRNGGGPACLRLRVPLEYAELAAVNPGSRFSPARHATLEEWVRRRYREDLRAADLADPQLLVESRDALDELTRILGIGHVYDFQR
jgi:succinylarginine dihydrolase